MGYNILLVGRKLENSLPLKRNYKTHRIDLFFNKGFLFYAEYNFRLFFYLLFKKKSIVLANDLDTLLANFLVSKLQKVKLVYDSHELFTEVPELINRPKTQKIWLKIEQWILPKLKNTYTVCLSIANYYNKKYSTNFKVVHNIPIYEKSKTNTLEQKNNAQKTIIYQGAVNVGRGLELLIDTMSYLKNYQLIIVGDGDILSDLKELVSKKQLDNNVQFLGKKTPLELKNITPLANLGVSVEEDLGLNYHFALPNKIFDYIHAKIPVLVSDLPEMAAIVKQFQIGEIIKDRTPKKLALQIEKILENDTDIYQKKIEKATEKLQWKNEEKVLIDIFKNLF
jgi:glycosyltransferase involved in cell wall biosynthesis